MRDYRKKYIRSIRLNTFHPLCETQIGRNAITLYNYPPFIDASCRREPDFENPHPSITSLCRQEKFAPQLYPNDIVVYMTIKDKWDENFDHYKLIAILEVIERKESHIQAKSWYSIKGIPIPSICMVEENKPYSFLETGGNYKSEKEALGFLNYPLEKQTIIGERRIKLWNGEYLSKSKRWGAFIITRPVFINLFDPPIVTPDNILDIFKKKINTRTPKKITHEEFREIAKIAGVNFLKL